MNHLLEASLKRNTSIQTRVQGNTKRTFGIKLEADFSCKGKDTRVALNLDIHFRLANVCYTPKPPFCTSQHQQRCRREEEMNKFSRSSGNSFLVILFIEGRGLQLATAHGAGEAEGERVMLWLPGL